MGRTRSMKPSALVRFRLVRPECLTPGAGHPICARQNMKADGRDKPGHHACLRSFAVEKGASALRLGLRAGRAGRAAAAVGHELIELGLVLGVAQPLQELLELALLLFEPTQRLGAILIERPIPARSAVAAAGPAPRGAFGVLPPPARVAVAVMPASHSSAP